MSALFADALIVLRRQRLLIAACALLAALAAAFVLARRTPRYEATVSIRVDPGRHRLPALDVLRAEAGNNLATELEMLRSRSLALAVAESLGLRFALLAPENTPRADVFSATYVAADAPKGQYSLVKRWDDWFELWDLDTHAFLDSVAVGQPLTARGFSLRLAPAATRHTFIRFAVTGTDAAAGRLLAGVSVVRRTRDADVVDLHVRGSDPQLARDAANAMAARFIAERRESRQSESQSTGRFLREQLARVSQQLRESERALREFRETAGVISVTDQASSEVRRAVDVLAQRDAIDAERTALDRLMQRVKAHGRDAASDDHPSYRDVVAFPTLLRNEGIGVLLHSLAAAEDRRAELLMRRKPTDPEVQVLTARTAQLERRLRTMTETYLAGLQDHVSALDDVLARSRTVLAGIPAKEMRFVQLQREVRALETLYGQLQSRLKETEVAAAADDGSVRVIDQAVAPTRPVNRSGALLLTLATLVGAATGFALGLLRELRDASVRTRADVEETLGVPVLGLVPRVARPRRLTMRRRSIDRADAAVLLAPRVADAPDRGRGAAQTAHDDAVTVHAYDRLHSNLLLTNTADRLRVLVFTSALPGDGKTSSATNLALTLARRGMRVALVDADLRRGRIHSVFGQDRAPGLSEVLSHYSSLSSVVRRITLDEGESLDVYTAGTHGKNPAPLLESPLLATCIDALRERYERVIIDTPPLNVVADAALVGAQADGVILVARSGATGLNALAFAGEQARHAHLELIGTVLTDIDFAADGAYDAAYQWFEYRDTYFTAKAAP